MALNDQKLQAADLATLQSLRGQTADAGELAQIDRAIAAKSATKPAAATTPPAPDRQPELKEKSIWQEYGNDIVYPGVGAAVGGALLGPVGVGLGTFAGEYAAQEMPHGFDRGVAAGKQTLVDLGLLSAGKVAKATKLGGALLDKADDVGAALSHYSNAAIDAVRDITGDVSRRVAAPTIREAGEAKLTLSGRGGKSARPPLATPADAETIGRPLADVSPNFPRNDIESAIETLEHASARPSVRRSAQARDQARRLEAQQLQERVFAGADTPAGFGEAVEKTMNDMARQLSDTDAEVWKLVADPRWTGSAAARGRASRNVADLLDSVDPQGSYQIATRSSGKASRNAVKDLIDLQNGLADGSKSMLDIDVLRKDIGNILGSRSDALGPDDRRVLGQVYHGLRDVQDKIIQGAKLPGDDATLAQRWAENSAKWKQYRELTDFVDSSVGGSRRYEAYVQKLKNDTKALRAFLDVAPPELQAKFAHTVASDIVDSAGSFASAQKAFRNLSPDVRKVLDADYGHGNVTDNLLDVAAFWDLAKREYNTSRVATINSWRPSTLLRFIGKGITDEHARTAYEFVRTVFPKIQTIGRPDLQEQVTRASRFARRFLAIGGASGADAALPEVWPIVKSLPSKAANLFELGYPAEAQEPTQPRLTDLGRSKP